MLATIPDEQAQILELDTRVAILEKGIVKVMNIQNRAPCNSCVTPCPYYQYFEQIKKNNGHGLLRRVSRWLF